MKIGMVGMGKLGFPVALAIESKGHEVVGYDVTDRPKVMLESKDYPHQEEGLEPLLNDSKIKMVELKELVNTCDIVFVAVQTPHEPEYEGITPVPSTTKDFDYTYIKAAMDAISKVAESDVVVTVISTMLPGTMDREIIPNLSSKVKIVYNPFFIAMGTVLNDFLNPEFVLVGTHEGTAASKLMSFYGTLHDSDIEIMSIRSAELTKVFYNTAIGTKIALANTLMEMCHKTGANFAHVKKALCNASDRLISTNYLEGGMGDGGGCHPRDNIAMAHLAKKINLSFNYFQSIMLSRDLQNQFFLHLINDNRNGMKIILLGRAFKPETEISTGSPALLLYHYAREEFGNDVEIWTGEQPVEAALYFISCKHKVYAEYEFPKGSVVIDPHRYIKDQEGVKVIRIGEHV